MMRVLIVDDEAGARAKVRRFLAAHDDCLLLGEAEDGRRATDLIRTLQPDLVFLDINMPERDGFEALAALDTGPRPHVVFTTAYDDRAVQAFEVQAVDYLLKPFDRARFDQALARVRARHAAGTTPDAALLRMLTGLGQAPRYSAKLVVQDGSTFTVVAVDTVEYVRAAGNYATLHCPGKQHLMRVSLNALTDKLDPRRFCRVHRGTIVCLAAVTAVTPFAKGDMVIDLRSGASVKLSRRYRDAFFQALEA